MCAFNPREQERLAGNSFSPLDIAIQGINTKPPWDSILDFATHKDFCGFPLFPRQGTLLKLMFLETENMTQFDIDVIEEWRRNFALGGNVIYGVQPDVWQRIEYLKQRGYRRFRHIMMVLGRRGSKGAMGGIVGCEQLAYIHSKNDPQKYYGIAEGKDVYMNVGATSQTQAARQLFADIRTMVENCRYFYPEGQAPWIAESKDAILRIRTPADLRRIARLKADGGTPDHIIASLVATALGTNSASGRGQTSFANFYDEFAFHVQTGSSKSDSEIYCLDPMTRVLCADLTWQPIGDLEPGQKIVGYDEFPDQSGVRGRRRLREATVEQTRRTAGEAFRITFTDGSDVVCSGNHRWLRLGHQSKSGGWGSPRWCAINPQHEPGKRTTRALRVGDPIKFLVEPWEEDNTNDGGWLAGMLDGEGHMVTSDISRRIGVTQTEGPVLDKLQRVLKDLGFEYYFHAKKPDGRRLGRHGSKPCWQIEINRLEQCLRLLGEFRPVRFLEKHKTLWEGRTISNAQNVKVIASIESIGVRELVDIQTSTKTFIAEGLVSHNSAWQPSLGQFGLDALTYIPSSPFTKAGQFYVLYEQSKKLMSTYNDETGMTAGANQSLINVGANAELDCDPTQLIFQAPSWELYRDWKDGKRIFAMSGVKQWWKFPKPPEPDMTSEQQIREQKANPDKFRVEKQGQFAEVEGQYLDSRKVDKMFEDPGWRPPLEPQSEGVFSRKYRIHCDPGRTGANFSLAIGHLEDAPPDEHGRVWPHVVFDLIKVWRPRDFPPDPETKKPTIDYVQVSNEIEDILGRFMSTEKISFDQWNSAHFIASIRQKFMPDIRVTEVTFTEQENQKRCEKFKSAINLGWVHSYRDNFYLDDLSCLQELELKFLSEKNGKVVKQDVGPVTTKDTADAVMVVAVDLLHKALDRWSSERLTSGAFGSTDSTGLKSGREYDRLETGLPRDNKAWRALDNNKQLRNAGRRRGDYRPDRLSSIHRREPKTPRSISR